MAELAVMTGWSRCEASAITNALKNNEGIVAVRTATSISN
jgi:hypothetical protein